jgi:hypothetical protein
LIVVSSDGVWRIGMIVVGDGGELRQNSYCDDCWG